MRARLAFLFISFMIAIVPACASRWKTNSVRPEITYQWPFSPLPAKVRYLTSLKGFSRDGSGSIFRKLAGSADSDQNSFQLPVAVAVDRSGKTAVADAGCQCVHYYDENKNTYRALAIGVSTGRGVPVSLTFDDSGVLYVADAGGFIHTFDNSGKPMQSLQSIGETKLQRPSGISYNPANKKLYVVDSYAHQVHAMDKSGAHFGSFGKRGEGKDEFNYPTHIAVSPAGNIFITDSMNFRIKQFDKDGKLIASFGNHGNGSGDLARPKGIAVDSDGVVYVVDSLFDNVQLFSDKGDFLLTVGKRGNDFAEFWLPAGAFIDSNQRFYVCDTYNHRVQIFQLTEGYHADN